MRTTVTLDSDVEQLLRERMAAHGISFKEAINGAVRDGAATPIDYSFETPSFDVGVTVDVTHANSIAGDLEDAAIVATLDNRP